MMSKNMLRMLRVHHNSTGLAYHDTTTLIVMYKAQANQISHMCVSSAQWQSEIIPSRAP
jgi:hypothetical protein